MENYGDGQYNIAFLGTKKMDKTKCTIQFVLSEDIKDNYLGDRGQLSQQKFMNFLPTFQN